MQILYFTIGDNSLVGVMNFDSVIAESNSKLVSFWMPAKVSDRTV